MANWNSANGAFFPSGTSVHETSLAVDKFGDPIDRKNAYGKSVITIDDDTVQHTSRNRRKISTNETFIFNQFTGGDDRDLWDEDTTLGGLSTFDQYQGGMVLSVSNTAGSEIVRETKTTIKYIPGRQNEIAGSIKLNNPQEGIRRRVGVFSANNGFYFEDDGGNYSVVIRRGTANGNVEERIGRDDWNVDKLDGNGPSGLTANAEAVQMFTFEYEWFGAGQVEFNWIIDNNKFPIHQFNTGNIKPVSWCNTPNLPYRLELTNVTGANGTHEMTQGGFSVSAEGSGLGAAGRRRNALSPITGRSLGSSANVFKPVLSVRLKEDPQFINAVVELLEFQAATLDNTDIFYLILRDPSLTGASFVSTGPYSPVEYDISATGITSNGTIVTSGFIVGTNQGTQVLLTGPGISTQIPRKNMGANSEIVTVAIAAVGANKSAFASIDWLEVR